jgi:hypothetical protein
VYQRLDKQKESTMIRYSPFRVFPLSMLDWNATAFPGFDYYRLIKNMIYEYVSCFK